MGFFSTLLILSLGSLMNPSLVSGSVISEQEKLTSIVNGDKKAYTDCEKYKKFTESKGISKEDADVETEVVDTRMDELFSDIGPNPEPGTAS